MTSIIHHVALRAAVCAGSLAIAALSMAAPASAQLSVFTSGGAFWSGGGPINYEAGGPFLDPGFITIPPAGGGGTFPPSNYCGLLAACVATKTNSDPNVFPGLGWDAAAGFDYRFAGTNWHVNAEGRFGLSKGSNSSIEAFSLVEPAPPLPPAASFSANINSAASLTEWHWFGDLGAGYDIIPSAGPNSLFEVKFGLRVAEVMTKNAIDDSSIFGFNLSIPGVVNLSASGVPAGFYWSKPITVTNVDMQVGFGYWFNPNWELAVSFRLDAYIDPLREFPDDTLPAQSVDRYFYGPQLTLVGHFGGPSAPVVAKD